jgi:hypothetical protein
MNGEQPAEQRLAATIEIASKKRPQRGRIVRILVALIAIAATAIAIIFALLADWPRAVLGLLVVIMCVVRLLTYRPDRNR